MYYSAAQASLVSGGRIMPMIARTLEEALAPIVDGSSLLVPRENAGVAMAATRALVRRGVRRLHLIAVPTSACRPIF